MKSVWKYLDIVAVVFIVAGFAVGLTGFGLTGFDPARLAAEQTRVQDAIADRLAPAGIYVFGHSPADYGVGTKEGALVDTSGLYAKDTNGSGTPKDEIAGRKAREAERKAEEDQLAAERKAEDEQRAAERKAEDEALAQQRADEDRALAQAYGE